MSVQGHIRIEGRGPVATALQLLLGREGIPSRALVTDDPGDGPPAWLAARPIALSLGSLQLLGRLVPALAPMSLAAGSSLAAPIRVVDIARQGTLGNAQMDTAELSVPLLGAVIRYGTLMALLREAVGVTTSPHPADKSDGMLPQCALRIVADGDMDPSTTRQRQFDQMALLAEVSATRDQPGVAYERFTSEGPLALLPLPEVGRRALVWCAPQSRARERANLEPLAFNAALTRAFGPTLGVLQVASPRVVSPVARRIGPLLREARTVAIGNAAQTLHPVAGQGLNLGLRDAAGLARQIGNVWAGETGIDLALSNFARQRRVDRELLVSTTDLLAALTRFDLLSPLYAIGLTTLELCAPLRRRVARGFMHGPRLF